MFGKSFFGDSLAGSLSKSFFGKDMGKSFFGNDIGPSAPDDKAEWTWKRETRRATRDEGKIPSSLFPACK